MHVSLLADATVSTGFLVVAYIAIAGALIVILSGLFGPSPRYKISPANSEDNTPESFIHVLQCLTDSQAHPGSTLTVLTNGDHFYEEELRAIASARASVNLEAYIFQRGDIAKRFLEA